MFSVKQETKTTLTIIGEFRSGAQLTLFKSRTDIYSHEKILYDLTKVIFMDSDSYRFIYEQTRKSYREVKWDIDSHVYKRYQNWLEGIDKCNTKS